MHNTRRKGNLVGRAIRAELEEHLNMALAGIISVHGRLVPGDRLLDGIMEALMEFDWSHCSEATPEAIADLRDEITAQFRVVLGDFWADGRYLIQGEGLGHRIIDILTRHGYIPTYWRPVTGKPEYEGDFQTDYDLIESGTSVTLRYAAEDGSPAKVTFRLKYRMDDGGPRVGQTAEGTWVKYGYDASGRLEGGHQGWWVVLENERPRDWWEGLLDR